MKAYTIMSNGWKVELAPRPRMKEGEFIPYPDTFMEEELEDIVGGYFRVIHLNDDVVMVTRDDAGDLPLNKVATELLHKAIPKMEDYVLGNVVVCRAEMIKGEEL